MLNIQHGPASLPQTTGLHYIAVPQRKQLAWKDVGREKPLGPLSNIFFYRKTWLKSKRLKADKREFTLKFLCLPGKPQLASMWHMQDHHKQKILQSCSETEFHSYCHIMRLLLRPRFSIQNWQLQFHQNLKYLEKKSSLETNGLKQKKTLKIHQISKWPMHVAYL